MVLADLADDDRRQALGRLVEHQEPRAGAQDARDRQHLLLAARQLAAAAGEPLGEIGKQREDALERQPAGRRDARRQQQVLAHAEAGEDGALLGADRHAEARDAVGREADRLAAGEDDRAAPLADDAHDRLEGRRLAGAVAAEQGDDLARPHLEIDAVEDVRFAVPGVQPGNGERRLVGLSRSHIRLPYRPA